MKKVIVKMDGLRKISSHREIKEGVRLFYELGHKIYADRPLYINGRHNWIRSGIFKEVSDPMNMLRNDDRIFDKDYIEHHNFHVL